MYRKLCMTVGMIAALAAQGFSQDLWKNLANYHYGDEPNATQETVALIQKTPPDQHGAIEAALIGVVSAPAATPDGKAFACRMLQQVGTDKSVPAVAGLLTDEVLSHYARLVLQRLGSPAATAALRAALDKAPDKVKPGLIGSLGECRDAQAVGALDKLARSNDPSLATAALTALGKIGGSAAAQSLNALPVPDSLQRVYWEALVICAGSLEGPAAVALCEKTLAAKDFICRLHAVSGLIRANEQKAIAPMTAFIQGDDEHLRGGALTIVANGEGSQRLTQAMTGLLGGLPMETRARLIMALGARGDQAALGPVTGYLSDTNVEVRAAVFEALGKIGDLGTVKQLLTVNDPQALTTLSRMANPGVNIALVDALDNRELRGSAIKAMVERQAARVAVPRLLGLLGDANGEVRQQAWQALRSLASGEDIAPLAKAAFALKDDKEQTYAFAALKNICASTDDKNACFDVIAGYYPNAPEPGKLAILDMGSAAGSPAALTIARQALQSGNQVLHAKALAVLAGWSNASAAPDLLALTKNATTETECLIALRGYISMAGNKGVHENTDGKQKKGNAPGKPRNKTTPTNKELDLDSNQRMEILKNAVALAQRPEEKKLIISTLRTVGNSEALSMLASFVKDPGVREEAEVTAVDLLSSMREKLSPEATKLAQELTASTNQSVAGKAKKILENMRK